MKNVLFFAALLVLVSCGSAETNSETGNTEADRSIGFNTMMQDSKFHLGTEEAIKVVKDLDVAWAAQDYEAMSNFFVDTATFHFEDGRKANSPAEFIEILQSDDEMSEVSWTFDFAYSIDMDPSRGGEHVQAGFTGTEVKDGMKEKKQYFESYYVVDGKIVWWRQYAMDILDDK